MRVQHKSVFPDSDVIFVYPISMTNTCRQSFLQHYFGSETLLCNLFTKKYRFVGQCWKSCIYRTLSTLYNDDTMVTHRLVLQSFFVQYMAGLPCRLTISVPDRQITQVSIPTKVYCGFFDMFNKATFPAPGRHNYSYWKRTSNLL